MKEGRLRGSGLSEELVLSEEEASVLRNLDSTLGLYRGLPQITETELRTLWATDRVLRDMLYARATSRDRRGEVAAAT